MIPVTDDKNPLHHSLFVNPGFPLTGIVSDNNSACIPGDKSLSHRAALLGAMADGDSIIHNFLVSGVTQAMLGALTELGIGYSLERTTLKICGSGLDLHPSGNQVTLQCGNSATTLRLLAGGLAAWGRPAVLDGSPGLRRRPMNRIINPLQQMGVEIEGDGGCAPLTFPALVDLCDQSALSFRLPVLR